MFPSAYSTKALFVATSYLAIGFLHILALSIADCTAAAARLSISISLLLITSQWSDKSSPEITLTVILPILFILACILITLFSEIYIFIKLCSAFIINYLRTMSRQSKLHAQTSTLWRLCVVLTETSPIGLRPSGLTSWGFIVKDCARTNLTHSPRFLRFTAS